MSLLFFFNGGQISPVVPGSSFMGWKETWFPGLVSVLEGVCPEATAIIKAQSINRANWETLILNNSLSLPFIVVESGEAEQEDWGRDNITWRQPLAVHYVTSVNTASAAVSGGGYDASLFAESRAIDISTSLISYSGSAFQILNKYPTFTVSESTPANQTIYKLQAPYFASTVKASLLWGSANLGVPGSIWGY